MENNVGDTEEDFGLLLARVDETLEFLITLISHHSEMILAESKVQIEVLSQKVS